ncbi:MAG: ABC transporter permease subunit [Treponema sp.]|jgi:thiamine transport system permease protein|nr:ABC transporter permease subunit [Treponema sp.]
MALPSLVLAVLAFAAPYAASLGLGFGGAGRDYLPLVQQMLPTLAFTLKQAALSTVFALALGLPGAWFLSSGGEGGNAGPSPLYRFARSLSALPFALPPILVVLGFALFFGNSGWLNRLLAALGCRPVRILYRPEAVILAHGFYNFPLVVRLAGDSLEQARRAYLPAAATLGASPSRALVPILLPLCLPGIVCAALLVFLYCFTSFAVVLILGGGPAASTLAVEIYRYARLSLDYEAAGILALAETAVAAAAFLLYLVLAGRLDRINTAADRNRPMTGRGTSPLALGIYALVMALVVLGPILSIPLESFLRQASRAGRREFSLYWWRIAGEGALPALGRSLLLAFSSAGVSCALAVLANGAILARDAVQDAGDRGGGRLLRALIRIAAVSPLASSGIVLGLGWLVLYGREQSRSLVSVILVHSVIALPFAFNSVSQGLANLPPTVMRAGAVFGAGPLVRIFTLALPIASGRIRSAWAFAAAISLGELNAVMMLGVEGWETLPLFIYRAAGAYRYGAACAGGTLLILCCAALFLLSDLGAPRSGGKGGR